MPQIYSILILFIVGIIAGVINVNAGGGSSLTLPALIFLGLDASAANGTNRLALIIQNLSALKSFKNENIADVKLSFKLSLFTLPGAVAGAIISTRIENETFKVILAIVMIGIVLSMFIPRKPIETIEKENHKIKPAAAAALIGIGFYGGFIQVGVGFLFMSSLYYLMQMKLVYVNLHKVFIILIYTIPALIIFIATDNVDFEFGLALAFGNALGAWWGTKFMIKKGDKFIKMILAAAIIIMSVKLIGAF